MGKLLSIVLVAAFLVHCSVEQDMGDMKKTTKDMKKTTKQMNRSTEQIKNRTEDLYRGARDIIAIANQGLTFEQVLQTKGTSNKLLNASVFFASMEFQHWQGDYEDSIEQRQELMTKAVRYFFWKIDDFVNDELQINTPFFVPDNWWFSETFNEEYHNWLNLSVLAVAMSKVHEEQVQIAVNKAVKVYSIYDIIKESLLAKKQYVAGKKVPDYVIEVLRNEKLAKYLLQLRHNFLPIILASKMSNIEDSFLEKLSHKYKWSSWSIGDWQLTFGGWEIDPGSFEKAEYAWFHEILAKGFETRNFLKSIGVNLIVNESVDKIFKNLTWVIHDDSRYQQLIQQLGMIPTFDQVEKFQGKIDFQPKVKTDPEKLIVLLNEYTGSTLFVFNKEGAERAKESEKELYKKMQELQQERQQQLHQKEHRELEKRFYNPDLVKGA